MAGRFAFPDSSSPAPSTPDRNRRHGKKHFDFGDGPSTTPAGPPPSSTASFTPAGAPSVSYLGSSIAPGMTGRSSGAPNPYNPAGSTARSLFSGNPVRAPKSSMFNASNASSITGNGPSARSARSARASAADSHGRRPSNLRNPYYGPDDDEEDDSSRPSSSHRSPYAVDGGDEDDYDAQELPPPPRPSNRPTGTFAMDYSDDEETEHEETVAEGYSEEDDHEEDAYGEKEDYTQDDDPYLMDTNGPSYAAASMAGLPVPGLDYENETDLMIAASHANERVLHEAEDLYRASTRFPGLSTHREMMFAREVKEMHSHAQIAELTETENVIIKTEELVARLYDEGVGVRDDPQQLDTVLANTSVELNELWSQALHTIDDPMMERSHTDIGPGPDSHPFRKAFWLASLVLEMHHTKFGSDLNYTRPALPEIMVDWMRREHEAFSTAQMTEVMRHRPSPACHTSFWQSLINTVARGNVPGAVKMLSEAGWQYARTPGAMAELAYTGQSLEHLQNAVDITIEVLQNSPAFKDNWDVLGLEWTTFRSHAKRGREKLVRLAEGKDRARGLGASARFDASRGSLSTMAREAESSVPWDVYMSLQAIFDIMLGKDRVILEACQDWCEATIALFAWLDEGVQSRPNDLSRSLQMNALPNTQESYTERLTRCFHVAVDDFPINPMDVDEMTFACAFESNFEGVVAGLRMWSLPIASAVAEVASLAGWLPRPEPKSLIVMESLGQEDLELLGVESRGPDENEGLKDTTLVEYAKALSGSRHMQATIGSRNVVRDGWEIAVQMLGRMDSRARSEELVGQVLENVLEEIDLDSSHTIDKIWTLLNALGMLNFAEETVESYANLLARESHRYGEALWYYALAHRPHKVREVLNLLMSYSLIQSSSFPPPSDLDDHLHRLLTQRTATLEHLAKTDLEAAELLGKMLAGYATLRKFYDIRDGVPGAVMGDREASPGGQVTLPPTGRQQAAACLVAVIASSDDNIRGGLYDKTRDAVVSEDFLLALLGEALVFFEPQATGQNVFVGDQDPDLSLEQLNVVFKAVEDIETVGTRVFGAAEEFFDVVIEGTPASGPLDMLKKSTTGMSGSVGGSFVMTGSSMLASQLHRSISSAGGGGAGGVGGKGVGGGAAGLLENVGTERGWDWRRGVRKGMGARDVLRVLRLGLSREVARAWVLQADTFVR